MIKLIKESAAAMINDYLAISDIHIGFESELAKKGYFVFSQTKKMIEHILDLKNKEKAKKIIILGDLKHEIAPKYKAEITDFLSTLSKNFTETIIIKGNHDGLIEKYCKGFKNIKVMDEFMSKEYLICHGHKMPTKESLIKASALIMGHFHSGYSYENYLKKKSIVKAWNFFSFDNKGFFSDKKIDANIGFILSFPSFSEFFSGSSEKTGPLKKFMKLRESITLNHLRIA
jgi:hypothetical protein